MIVLMLLLTHPPCPSPVEGEGIKRGANWSHRLQNKPGTGFTLYTTEDILCPGHHRFHIAFHIADDLDPEVIDQDLRHVGGHERREGRAQTDTLDPQE